MSGLTLQEMETVLMMSAEDRYTWHIFSDDVVMQRRLEAVGATLIRQATHGVGKYYTLPSNQVTIKKAPKPLSEERKAELGNRLRDLRARKA